MSFLSEISFRRGLGLLLVVLSLLLGGTWLTISLTIDHLLNQSAMATARDWATFLAANVTDFDEIAAGEQPSAASLAFFQATRQAGQVFRYVIFNSEGYSQLVSDRNGISLVNLSSFSATAARAAVTGLPIIDARTATAGGLPAYYAEAYIPVVVKGKPVATVAAFVDQSKQRNEFYRNFVMAAAVLCLLTALSFGVPAIAWYRRTREKQRADRRIRYLAQHDALTGLINRASMLEKLERALATLPLRGSGLAVHFIDIDRFKEVNDTLGHDGGDFLLKTVAERLVAVSRFDDLVARLGGDEFVAIQRDVRDKPEVEAFASRLAAAVSTPVRFKEQEIVTTCSIGIAMAPSDGTEPERLLKSADLALYRAKSDGRNCNRFFVPEMDATLLERLKLERIVREAVKNDRFELHYQPVFEVANHRLIGFEALIRLPAPDGTLIPPMTFIPVAEEIRLIDKIGAWVLREACRIAATWPEHLTVAVNLSPTQFESWSISQVVAEALEQAGLAPHRLELEITETLLLRNSETVVDELNRLRAMGVAIVMDDFGTGYSSLSYLWRFPFSKIKIDRSFVQGFSDAGRNAETVVKTIVALGRELHMQVTVEGVETASQARAIERTDPDQVQGFFFGRPMPQSEIAAVLLKDFQDPARWRRPAGADRSEVGTAKRAAGT